MVRLHVFPLTCHAMRACLRTIAFTLGGAPLVLEVGGWKSVGSICQFQWQNWVWPKNTTWMDLATNKFGMLPKKGHGATCKRVQPAMCKDLAFFHLQTWCSASLEPFFNPVYPHLFNPTLKNDDPNHKNEHIQFQLSKITFPRKRQWLSQSGANRPVTRDARVSNLLKWTANVHDIKCMHIEETNARLFV